MPTSRLKPLRVALLGCGVVGSEVVRLLHEQGDDLAARVGAPLELAGIAVRRPSARRDLPVDPALFTTDAAALVARDDVDVVVEVVGGIEPARTLAAVARSSAARASSPPTRRCSPRTARPCTTRRADGGADLYYEASVAGAIPLLRPLRESPRRRPRHPRARHRQRHHELHPDPDGRDRRRLRRGAGGGAARSATPRPTRPPTSRGSTRPPRPRSSPALAFHTRVTAADVHREGITEVTAADVASARAMGCAVKLLAIAERDRLDGRGRRRARAPGDDPAQPPAGRRPRGVQRGVRRGRGRRPADVLRPRRRRRADRERRARRPGRGRPQPAAGARGAGESATPTCRCCRWARRSPATTSASTSTDKAGVLAAVAEAFAEHDVSIADRPAGGPRRRCAARAGHPHRDRRRARRDRRAICASWTSSAPWPA